jgi:hypothetical protein
MGKPALQARAILGGRETARQVFPVQCLMKALIPRSVGSTVKPVAHASTALGALMLVKAAWPLVTPKVLVIRHHDVVALDGCCAPANRTDWTDSTDRTDRTDWTDWTEPESASAPPAATTTAWRNGQPNM